MENTNGIIPCLGVSPFLEHIMARIGAMIRPHVESLPPERGCMTPSDALYFSHNKLREACQGKPHTQQCLSVKHNTLFPDVLTTAGAWLLGSPVSNL